MCRDVQSRIVRSEVTKLRIQSERCQVSALAIHELGAAAQSVCVRACVCVGSSSSSSSDFTSETTSVAMDVQSSITYALRIRNTSDRYAANRFQSVPFVGFISVQK